MRAGDRTPERAAEEAAEEAVDHLGLVREVVGLWVEMQSRLQDHFAALAAEQSLTAMQAKVLIQLDPDGAVTMRALAQRLQYDPSNLTGVVDRLEAAGAVERRSDPQDRRVRGIVLTPRGAEIRDAFWRRLINDAGPLGHLDAGDLARLGDVLRRALARPDAGNIT